MSISLDANTRSAELFDTAQESIAGGVTSVVRGTSAGWLPYPPMIQRGDGSHDPPPPRREEHRPQHSENQNRDEHYP